MGGERAEGRTTGRKGAGGETAYIACTRGAVSFCPPLPRQRADGQARSLPPFPPPPRRGSSDRHGRAGDPGGQRRQLGGKGLWIRPGDVGGIPEKLHGGAEGAERAPAQQGSSLLRGLVVPGLLQAEVPVRQGSREDPALRGVRQERGRAGALQGGGHPRLPHLGDGEEPGGRAPDDRGAEALEPVPRQLRARNGEASPPGTMSDPGLAQSP